MNWKKQLLAGLDGTGVDQFLLRAYDEVVGTTGGAEPALKNFDFEEEPRGTVVFPLIPAYRSICYRYCVIADAFRRRGYRPILLVDDDTLNAPFERTVDQNGAATAQMRYYRRRIPEKFGIETTPVSSLLDTGRKEPRRDSIREIDFERFARGSTRKHFRIYTIDEEDDSVTTVRTKFVEAGRRLATCMEALFENYDVSAVITHEPYYVHGGIPMEVAGRFDTPAYSQVWGYRKGTLLFGKGGSRSLLPQYADSELVDSVLSEPLTDDESERLDQILRERASGQNLNVDYSAHTNESVAVDSDETLVAVFTNLLWDASLEPEQAVYADVFEWLSDTLNVLGGRDKTYLVIKTHPAEAKLGTNESVTDWFDERTEIPENVDILPPDTDVDTYSLLDEIDAAVVYNSTVGLEAAYRGVPVVVAGDTHYRDFGMTIDPDSKTTYQDLLSSVEGLECDDQMQRLATRYAHLLFVKRLVPFEFCQREQGGEQDLEIVRASDTGSGSEPFDTIIPAILDGRPVLNPEYNSLSFDD